MNHDNIITMCYVNEEEHDIKFGDEFNDMANFDMAGFKNSILTQCKGK